MKRGELWTAATGSGFGSKPLPVLVVQGDAYAEAPNIIVALLTTVLEDGQGVRPKIEPDGGNGLEQTSLVQVDLLVAAPKRKFGRRIGHLSLQDQAHVDRAVLIYLGFGGSE